MDSLGGILVFPRITTGLRWAWPASLDFSSKIKKAITGLNFGKE
jgi:hypothetical protein